MIVVSTIDVRISLTNPNVADLYGFLGQVLVLCFVMLVLVQSLENKKENVFISRSNRIKDVISIT